MDLSRTPVPNQSFCVRNVGDETVFLSESGSEVLSLNEVGSFIWRQIDGQRTLNDVLDAVCAEYEVERDQARTDLEVFILQMEDRGLVTTAG